VQGAKKDQGRRVLPVRQDLIFLQQRRNRAFVYSLKTALEGGFSIWMLSEIRVRSENSQQHHHGRHSAMLRKTLFTIIFALLLAVPALAGGTSIIYGAVNDNGAPLENALVTIIGEATYTSKSVTTDSRGIYVIEGLPADEYIVRALAKPDGIYKPGERNIFLGKGKEKEVNFSMKKR